MINRITMRGAIMRHLGRYYCPDREQRNELQRAWRHKHREHVNEQQRAYRRANRERVNAYQREWKARWRQEHPDLEALYVQTWLRKNPLIGRVQASRKRARELGAPGDHTVQDIEQLYEQQAGLCRWCGQELPDNFHVDHIVPFRRGGTNNPDNLALACPSCNASKGNKLVEEWPGPPALRKGSDNQSFDIAPNVDGEIKLLAAVVHQAVKDARAGDPTAQHWLRTLVPAAYEKYVVNRKRLPYRTQSHPLPHSPQV